MDMNITDPNFFKRWRAVPTPLHTHKPPIAFFTVEADARAFCAGKDAIPIYFNYDYAEIEAMAVRIAELESAVADLKKGFFRCVDHGVGTAVCGECVHEFYGD